MATTIASTAADGTQGNATSTFTFAFGRILSNDGRYVVFHSNADNLVGTDANGSNADIFRKDLTTNAIVRVNETAAGVQSGGSSVNASMSADGRYVVFQSTGTGLVGSDANGSNADIFRKDLTTNAIVRVSQTAAGVQANRASGTASISGDGRYVVFQSEATNLVTGTDANGISFDIFRKDLATNAIVRVNESAAGVQSGGNSFNASMSADGRYVVFQSAGTNLVAGPDANGSNTDIFRKDLTTNAIVRVNETLGGVQGNGGSADAAMSADGRYVVFTSNADNLVGTDANGTTADIFRKDLTTGELVRVNDTADGVQANDGSFAASISGDGRYVTFQSLATNLVAGADTNNTVDIFVKDMVTGALARVSNADGTTSAGNGASTIASISGDGSRIVFASTASNLVAGDGNVQQDVFVTDNPVCFAAGSAIRVVREGVARDVAVEALAVGDLAVTASGALRPIRWIGHRAIACRGRADLLPVRIAAGAFGEGRPARDLFVSPAHAVCVDILGEVLIPACRLVNGTTIAQVDAEEITYWHVELDGHDILLADGLPAESYLECGNRRFFANAVVTDLAAGPDTRPEGPLRFCRPFHEAGLLVDLVRARLSERAEALGWRLAEDAFAGLHLVADGRVIQPDAEGLIARFVVPADAGDVRLMSQTSVPAHVLPGSTDARRLGVPLAALTIDDGLTGARTIAPDDARLGAGFHGVEGRARWTDGAASLPASLWAGCRGAFFLRVELPRPALPRWVGPHEADGIEGAGFRRRA